MYIYMFLPLSLYIYIERDIHLFSLSLYIYIYTHISRPRGDRKFGGCFLWACLGGDFGGSALKERRSERARLD